MSICSLHFSTSRAFMVCDTATFNGRGEPLYAYPRVVHFPQHRLLVGLTGIGQANSIFHARVSVEPLPDGIDSLAALAPTLAREALEGAAAMFGCHPGDLATLKETGRPQASMQILAVGWSEAARCMAGFACDGMTGFQPQPIPPGAIVAIPHVREAEALTKKDMRDPMLGLRRLALAQYQDLLATLGGWGAGGELVGFELAHQGKGCSTRILQPCDNYDPVTAGIRQRAS